MTDVECLLLTLADIQSPKNPQIPPAAFGQKQTVESGPR